MALATNSEHFGAARFAGRFPSWFTVFEGNLLNIFPVSLSAALYAVEIWHRLFSPPFPCLAEVPLSGTKADYLSFKYSTISRLKMIKLKTPVFKRSFLISFGLKEKMEISDFLIGDAFSGSTFFGLEIAS